MIASIFDSSSYEVVRCRGRKLSSVEDYCIKAPFVVVLFVSCSSSGIGWNLSGHSQARETGVIAASWTHVHRHWTTFGDSKTIPPGSPFSSMIAPFIGQWPELLSAPSEFNGGRRMMARWFRKTETARSCSGTGAAGRDATKILAADTCKRRRVDPYPKSSQHLFAAGPNLESLTTPESNPGKAEIIIDFRRQPIHNG